MSKVVINSCYGGFSLSSEATRAYLRRKGIEWTEEQDPRYTTFGPYFYIDGDKDRFFTCRDIQRTDPDLVAVVEEMGDAANGRCASLEIVDLESGTHYFIDEYDGYESIQTRDGIDWQIA